jgi:hypothetical protein
VQNKYEPIQVDDACVTRVEKAGYSTLPLGWRDFLSTPITGEELKATVREGACNKAPGGDDMRLEFFKFNWDSTNDNKLALLKNVLGWSDHGTTKP